MSQTTRIAVLIVAVAALAVPALASEHVLTLDPATSEVAFDLSATGHDVHGAFTVRSGEIRFDPDTGVASGELIIDAASAGTGNKKRDKTMRKKVLHTLDFPAFVFHPQGIEGHVALAGESHFTIHGVLELLGQEHPLDLETTARVDGDRVSASTHFPIPYVAWGLHDPSFLFLRVAKEVEVQVTGGGSLRPTDVAAIGTAR
jgi:polyisoprenoid-binding protein YceI